MYHLCIQIDENFEPEVADYRLGRIDSAGHRGPTELDRAKGQNLSALVAYVIDTNPAYAGYGRLNREAGDWVKELLRAATQFYVIDGNAD
jgi:hypothetical protein